VPPGSAKVICAVEDVPAGVVCCSFIETRIEAVAFTVGTAVIADAVSVSDIVRHRES
jgi:hypothetical protein